MGAPRPYGQLQLLNIGAERKRLDAERRRCLRLMRDGRRCQRIKHSVEADWCGDCRHELARSSYRKRDFSKPKQVTVLRPIVAGSVRHLWLAAIQKARPVIREDIRAKVRELWARSVAGATLGRSTAQYADEERTHES